MLYKLNKTKKKIKSETDIFLEMIRHNLILIFLFRQVLDISENTSNQEPELYALFMYDKSSVWMPRILEIVNLSELDLISKCIEHLSIDKNNLSKKILELELSNQKKTEKGKLQLEFELNYFLACL